MKLYNLFDVNKTDKKIQNKISILLIKVCSDRKSLI